MHGKNSRWTVGALRKQFNLLKIMPYRTRVCSMQIVGKGNTEKKERYIMRTLTSDWSIVRKLTHKSSNDVNPLNSESCSTLILLPLRYLTGNVQRYSRLLKCLQEGRNPPFLPCKTDCWGGSSEYQLCHIRENVAVAHRQHRKEVF